MGFFSNKDTETSSSPPRAVAQVLAAISRNRQESGKWGGRRAAWHSAGQGVTGEKPQGRPYLESQSRSSTLSCHHLSCTQQGPGTTGPFKTLGKCYSAHWPGTPGLQAAKASQDEALSRPCHLPALVSARFPSPAAAHSWLLSVQGGKFSSPQSLKTPHPTPPDKVGGHLVLVVPHTAL